MIRWHQLTHRYRSILMGLALATTLVVGVVIGLLLGSRSKTATTSASPAATVTVAATIDRQTVITACEQNIGVGVASSCPMFVDTVIGIATRLDYRCTTAQLSRFVVDDMNGRFTVDQFTAAFQAACSP